MLAYSNHGTSYRAIDPGMETPDEVVFDHCATDAELLAAFPAYVSPAILQAQDALKAQAQALLGVSDIQVVRCVENGVALPDAWKAYRAALRAIVSSGTGAIPERPDWP